MGQPQLFLSQSNVVVEQVSASLNNAIIQGMGPEIVFNKIYDAIGFDAVKQDLFRQLALAGLVFSKSKLKTTDSCRNHK